LEADEQFGADCVVFPGQVPAHVGCICIVAQHFDDVADTALLVLECLSVEVLEVFHFVSFVRGWLDVFTLSCFYTICTIIMKVFLRVFLAAFLVE